MRTIQATQPYIQTTSSRWRGVTEHITSSGGIEKVEWSKGDGDGSGGRERGVLSDQTGREIVVKETGKDAIINIVGHSEGRYQQRILKRTK